MASKPFKHDLSIYQGATFRDVSTWKVYPYPVEHRNGQTYKVSDGSIAPKSDMVPVDLTGCTARMHARAKIGDTAVLLTLTTENGGITLGSIAGTITMYLSPVATAALAWKGAVYDLEIVFTNGDVRRLLAGSVSVSQEVTR